MKISDLEACDGTLQETDETISTGGLRAIRGRLFPPGTLLFAIYGSIGKMAFAGCTLSTNQAILGIQIRAADKLDSRFLFRWLESRRSHFLSEGLGIAQKNLSAGYVRSLEVPLPPLVEQQRIAAILDQADNLRRLRQRAIDRLNSLGQAIFSEMFGDPATNPKAWPMGTIDDLTASTQYGTSGKAGEAGAFPILRMGNITESGALDYSKLKYIDLATGDRQKYTVRDGDLLFNRTNSPDLVGKTAVYRGTEEYAFAGYLVRLRTNARAVPEYVGAYLNGAVGKKTLRGMCKAIIGMANINAKDLRTIPIPLAPIELQEEFQQRIFAAQSMLTPLEEHRRELDTLFSSLQYRAFRGEL